MMDFDLASLLIGIVPTALLFGLVIWFDARVARDNYAYRVAYERCQQAHLAIAHKIEILKATVEFKDADIGFYTGLHEMIYPIDTDAFKIEALEPEDINGDPERHSYIGIYCKTHDLLLLSEERYNPEEIFAESYFSYYICNKNYLDRKHIFWGSDFNVKKHLMAIKREY
jgi:hypothetical protein